MMPTETTPLKEVKIRKAAEIVANQIRGAIIRGELTSGDALPAEAHLTATFGVSRPTLREAIRILESEHLISVSRGARGGARISTPSLQFLSQTLGHTLQAQKVTLDDVYAARCLIEPPAARMAAETRPIEAADALEAYVQNEFKVMEDRPKVSAAVAGFHRLLVQQSGNKTLAVYIEALYQISERHLAMVHRYQDQQEADNLRISRTFLGFRSHAKLVKFIRAGDGEGAERHWADHMKKASQYWLQGFGNNGIDVLD